jgi:hypothetical protein
MYKRRAETTVHSKAVELSFRKLIFPTRKKVSNKRRVMAVSLKKKNLKENKCVLKIDW